MAVIGLKHVYAAPYEKYDATTKKPVYGKGFWVGSAIQADETVNFGNNPLYADDRTVDNDTDFTDGTLTIGIAEFGDRKDDTMKIRAAITGETYQKGTGEETDTISLGSVRSDNYVGIGYIKTGRYQDGGGRFYAVTWYYRVKFKPGSESANTKGGSTTWQTPSVEGEIYEVPDMESNKNIRFVQRFETEEAALAKLKELANYTEAESGSGTQSPGQETEQEL